MKTLVTMLAVAALLAGSVAFAGDQRDERVEKVRDKATYDQLVGQVRQVEAQYNQVVTQAMKEARESNGSASLETQSNLIALREKRDRLLNRLLLVSLRWGWDMPDMNAPAAADVPVRTQTDQVFESAERVIKALFSSEAKRIAMAVKLPVTSVPAGKPQLGLQVLTMGLVLAYIIAVKRHEIGAGEAPWEKTLGQLSAIATSVGLFGTIVGFIQSFGAFRGTIDVQRVSAGLAVAFYTTGMGMVTALIAIVGQMILGLIRRER